MSPVIGSCMVVTCFPYIRQRNIRTVKTPESDIDIEDKKLKTKWQEVRFFNATFYEHMKILYSFVE